ncbi:MAG: hypothetical protein NVS4B13_04080 [Candidatus Elarobacter sp.]
MSTISSTPTSALGSGTAPISFPGIASGIDYNTIIQKYTDITLAQAKPLQLRVTALTAQQAEFAKIQSLISKFQATFEAISNPSNFNATSPTSSNASALAASSIAGSVATPGTYVITKSSLATATQITNDPAANGAFDPTVAMINAGASITPNNGPAGATSGKITINGVTLQYDVTTQSLNTWINNVANPALAAAGSGASLSYAGGKVTVTSSKPLTLGGATDSGNLLQVLKLDTAPITLAAGVYSATSATNIGGINLGATFNTPGNAGFATPVTAGNFTINGVVFKVMTTNNLNDVLGQINASSAGVIATYDAGNDRIVLTSKANGPQGIVLGKSGDTSNFLQAAGFLTNYTAPNGMSAGAQLVVGKSASVQYIDSAGTSRTVYSNSNDVTTVIPGVNLKLLQAVDGVVVTPVTVTVAQDATAPQASIKAFIASYNALIDEINTATQAPVVGSSSSASGQPQSTQLTTGGVLYNNQEVLGLKQRLVSLVSSLGGSSITTYNSLSAVGLTLDASFSVPVASAPGTTAPGSTTPPAVTQRTSIGTSGRLNDLDVTKLSAAMAANSNAVAALFTGSGSIIGQMGAYLTGVSGLPTQLTGSLAGNLPARPLFRSLTSSADDQITSLQRQIKLVTDRANSQADILRAQFLASETQIAKLQSLQSSLGALFAK